MHPARKGGSVVSTDPYYKRSSTASSQFLSGRKAGLAILASPQIVLQI